MTPPPLLKTALQVITDGPPAAKLGATGFAVLLAALTDVATGVAFASVVALWLADMLLGLLRAIGERSFSFWRFLEGFLKGAAAALGIYLATILDTMGAAAVSSYQGNIASTGAMAGIAVALAWSALENLGHWFPAVAEKLRGRLSGQAPPERIELAGLSEETRSQLRSLAAQDPRAKRGGP